MRPPRPRALLCLFAAALLAACQGESGEPASPPKTEQTEAPSPAIFAIRSRDGQIKGWLFGTIHALPDGVDWRSQALDRAIATSRRLVVEIDGSQHRRARAAIFEHLARTPGLPPLSERLEPPQRERLRALLESGGFDEGDFADVETWAAALILAQIERDGSPEHGVDRALIRAFGGRPISQLEGTKAQLSIFDRLPEREQVDLLVAMIDEIERRRADPDRLRRAWLSGDLETIEALTQEGLTADPQLRAALLTGRNHAWVDKIAAWLRSGEKPLIAVGAAHLVGPDGLVQLLGEQGYRVERIE